MTAGHLLDAMGLLDDELVRQAEEYRPASRRGRWMGMAAGFAVVLVLGYGLTHFGMGGSSTGKASGGAMSSAPAGGSPPPPAASAPAPAPTEGSAGDSETVYYGGEGGGVWIEEQYYALLCETAEELPADSVPVGTLSGLYPDAPSPTTNVKEYEGLEICLSPEDNRVYVGLSNGSYAVGELVQP